MKPKKVCYTLINSSTGSLNMSIKTTLSGDSEMEEALFGDMELEDNIGEEKGEEEGDSL